MTDKDRLLNEFQTLVGFDAESGCEAEIRAYLREKLVSLGLEVTEDAAGNLLGVLPGTREGEPLLFSSHMDTVSPGKGKRAILGENGVIRSDGTTVLGADDAAGLAAILEALTVIREKALEHPALEILFTVQEELYSGGGSAFDYRALRSRTAYVLDLTGPIGTAALCAPSILSLDISVQGKAAHAGFAPEEGVNALTIAARALSTLETGHVEADTTVNFGMIEGGQRRNIVPEQVHIRGEIRSLRHERAIAEGEKIRACFAREAEKLSGRAEVTVKEEVHAYRTAADAPVVRRFQRALDSLGYGEAKLIETFGGSDNNVFALFGLEGIVLACAMENVHSTAEYCVFSELQKSAELTLRLMTLEDGA